jgi:hypothetical protein
MKHGIDSDEMNHEYFGTTLMDQQDVEDYIIGRAATFFQAIIINIDEDLVDPANGINNIFLDCENRRKGADLVNDDDC